jgi:pyridoxamine 5'-phosphate oxidase
MDKKAFLAMVSSLIDEAKTAVLATVDGEGAPHLRWMTPTILKDRPGAVYAVTSPEYAKSAHIAENPRVQWMFQTRLLDRVATVTGLVNMVENSAMKAEVLEAIGRRLTVFWRVNTDASKLVVLETVIQSGTYFEPMKAKRESVDFS